MSKLLHIVSFNVPWPANYGGVVDVFHRIRTLAQMGVRVHLHTFTYGRPGAKELLQYCERVDYYRRDMSPLRMLARDPFIVASRHNKQLLIDLRQDDAPVLLEGLHCCSLLDQLEGRPVLVRAHNVEHDYYDCLAQSEPNPLRRLYLKSEARKLRRYEPVMKKATAVLAVTESDKAHFEAIGCDDVLLMPSSHPCDEVLSNPGMGSYALYHADLSVPDNHRAAMYLIDNVFSDNSVPVVIAGRDPLPDLAEVVGRHPNIRLVANPDDEAMHQLLADAQVNVLVTNQPTGLKLKLLNALYAGRHCLVNGNMVAGTSLGEVCHVADNPQKQREKLGQLMQQPFGADDLSRRKQLLGNLYSNSANARILASVLGWNMG